MADIHEKNDSQWSQDPLVKETERRDRWRDMLNDVMLHDISGDISLGSGFKYSGSDKELTIGDVVSYKDESGRVIEGVVIDYVPDDCNSETSCVKLRESDGRETWGNPRALTLLREYRNIDLTGDFLNSDGFCPFVRGRCRCDCVMQGDHYGANECQLISVLDTLGSIFCGDEGLQIGEDRHGVTTITRNIDWLRRKQGR